MLFNINYTDEDLVAWSTQNRFLDDPGRVSGIPGFAEQTDLSTNPDAGTPIWDRFDPNEVRTTRDELTFNASFDFKLSDDTTLYFRPWYQQENDDRDSFAFRVDRLERAFQGNWWFMDDAGNPLGTWVEDDNDPVLGSAGDTFVQQVDGSGNVVVTPNFEANRDGRIDRIITGSNIEAETYTFDFGGETAIDGGLVEYRLLFSSDEGDNFNRQYRFQERFDDGRAGDRLRASFFGTTPLPEFSIFEVTSRRGHVPSNGKADVFGDANRTYNDTSPRFTYENVTEDVMLASVDLEKEINNNLTLKTGARFRSATRDNVTTQLFFSPAEGARRVYPAGMFADPADGGFTLWDGKYADTAGPFVRADPAYQHFFDTYQADPTAWRFARSDLRDAADTAELTEDVLAAYLQGTFRKGDWTLVTGLRFEKTELDTTWKPSNFVVDGTNIPNLSPEQQGVLNSLVQAGVSDLGFVGADGTFSFGDIVDDINRKSSYDNVLPSAVLTYRAGESGHVFRLAYTNTLTRPDYRELVPFNLGEANRQLQAAGVLNLTNRDDEFDLGNPNLTEQTSVNFDAAWEYYFGPGQRNTLSVTYFSKSLEDFLQEDTFRRDIELLIDPDDPSLGTEFVTSDTNFWSNASSRSITGVEVSGYFNMEDIIPGAGFLKGLSFVPNYARITGDQTDPIFDQAELENGNFVKIGESFTDSLTNQAKEIYNLQFIYERQRFNVRLSYNYISRLQRTPSTAAISAITFDRESESVDLSIQYRLFKDRDTRLFFEADNLTDTPGDERYIGSTPGLYTTSYSTHGRRYVFGIRGSF
jgi:TonB-dependent receptor